MSASHPWISGLYDSNWQATAHAHTGSWSQGHGLIVFWSVQHSATLGFTCELKIIIIIKKKSYPVAHRGERASLLFTRQRYVSHTGMLHATFVLADIRAPELLPRGVVQRRGRYRWSWSQTAFWAGGGSSPFSIPSPPAPILGLATVPLTCQKLRSQNRCWDLGCKSWVLRTGPSAKPL